MHVKSYGWRMFGGDADAGEEQQARKDSNGRRILVIDSGRGLRPTQGDRYLPTVDI
jgi:hypothetical protein